MCEYCEKYKKEYMGCLDVQMVEDRFFKYCPNCGEKFQKEKCKDCYLKDEYGKLARELKVMNDVINAMTKGIVNGYT